MTPKQTSRCPYCGDSIVVVDSSVVYGVGHDYGLMNTCKNYPQCDSYCGHGATLANRELRELRKQCHRKFDVIWKSGKMKRKEAYNWLCQVMKVSRQDGHIALFRDEQCKKLLDILKTV
jgi:hypothetical protein